MIYQIVITEQAEADLRSIFKDIADELQVTAKCQWPVRSIGTKHYET